MKHHPSEPPRMWEIALVLFGGVIITFVLIKFSQAVSTPYPGQPDIETEIHLEKTYENQPR